MKTEQEVVEEFFDSLELPPKEKWPPRQMILAPVGLPGSGKTTVVTPMARELGLVRVSSDEFRKLLKENGYDWGYVKDLMFPVDERLAKEGYSIAFDADACNPETVAFIDELSKKYDMKVFWVRLNTPKEVVFERFKKEPPSWLSDDPEKRMRNYESQEERYKERNLDFDYVYSFDTSRDNVDEQIKECLQRIKTNL